MNKGQHALFSIAALLLLLLMAILAGGAALQESVTIDEVAHIGAGVSYLQKLDLRLNQEHPPLPKMLAAVPLVLRGTCADYSHVSWTMSEKFFPGYLGEWVFGEWLLSRWNDPVRTLAWARAPMLLLTLLLGWILFVYTSRLGGKWAGLLCLSVYVSTPTFLAFGPLVHTDMAVTLFSLIALWRFAGAWQTPARKNILLFALGLAGALLSKFTAGILFFAFLAFALSTRWRPVPGQPEGKREARAWRRSRWRATLQGILGAAALVYLFYSIFSIKQPTGALSFIGDSWPALALKRILFPPVVYFRAAALVLFTSNRPTFVLGHAYPHGKWFYFPVLLLLKSSLGFITLLVLAPLIALARRRLPVPPVPVIPTDLRIHWRVLWVALVVFTAFCLLSGMDISIRHFSVPLLLLIVLLSAVPRMISRHWDYSRNRGRILVALTTVLVFACLFTALRAYPYFFPYLNSFSFGHPGYALVNDSNLDWNQSLSEVRRFAEQHGLQRVRLDEYGFNDPSVYVPQAELWNCQSPVASDAGQWAIVSGNVIMDGHNCLWLTHLPLEPLAGGSMYAIHLPEHIPEAGTPGGPPLPSDFRQIAGAPFDTRGYFLNLIHHPEQLPQAVEEMQARYRAARQSEKQRRSGPDVK